MSDNSDLPLVSVIITGRNEQNTIENCILSIFSQDYPNFEVIYVDAKSSDNSIEYANKLRVPVEDNAKCKRYLIILAEADSPGRGRNVGVKAAKGAIIAFVDADCVAEKDWLTNLVGHLPVETGMVGGPNVIRHFKKSKAIMAIDSVLSTYLGSGGSPQFYNINKDCETYAVSSCNMAIQKTLFEKIGGFNESLRYNEDSDLCNRMRKGGYTIVYTPSARVDHFLGIESYSDFASHFYRYGYERGKNASKNSGLITRFNALSLVTIIAITSLLVFSIFVSVAFTILVLLITAIISILIIISLKIAITNKSELLFFFVLAIFVTLYAVYNAGFVLGYLSLIRNHLH
jgi:GT2 family glycosyltransferase